MHHNQNLLTIRILTITAVLLAVVAGLSFYETSKLDNLSVSKKVLASPTSQKVSPSPASLNEASGSSVEVTGPGNCVGIDQCLKYCQDHPEECAKK